MDREQPKQLHQHSQALASAHTHALSTEVPLPGLRVLGTLGISARGTLYAVRWEPRSTREPALLALRVADDPAGELLCRLAACAARTEVAAMDGLAVPIDHGTTASGRTYYTTELFERDLGRLPAALQPALPVLLTDVARVLAAMHARGLVHGNLHAGNVLIKEHAASYSIALCDPAILTGRDVSDPAEDLAAWASLAAHAYGHRVTGDGRCVADEGAAAMPAGLRDIVESVLAGGGPTPAQPWTASELVQALEGLAGADSGAVPRMRLAVGSGPTRSESAHARKALQRAGFEVLACLGQGAAATVFRVRRGGRELAAKVLHGPRAMERLACACAALDRLRGESDAPLAIPEELGTLATGAAFYTMDVFGSTLRGRASELDLPEALEVLGEVARGLARLHRLGVVHRDLKPSNVLLTRHDRRHRVAVSDFELALVPDHEGSTGELAGTPAQRPPEADGGRVTPAWDVWSWAVTALWVLGQQLRAHAGAAGAMADATGDALGDTPGDAGGQMGDAVPGLVTDGMSTIVSGAASAAMSARVIDPWSDFSTEVMSTDEAGDAFVDTFWDASGAMPDPAWLRARAAELAPVLPASIGALLAACLESDPARRPGADAVAACVTREVARLRAPAASESIDAALPAHAVASAGGRVPSERLAGEPFAGLRALTAAELEQCVGRSRDVACLVQLIGAHRLVVLLGPAGAGKSSVLAAGLVPELAALAASGGPRYRPIVMRPGPHPFASLAAALLASPAGGERVRPSAAHVAHLAAALRKRGLAALAPLLGNGPFPSDRPLLIVDQAEELFTAVHDAGERHAFAALLGEVSRMAAGGAVPVTLFAVRDGCYGQLLTLPVFTAPAPDGHGYHCLQPLDRAALQAVLEQGAARHGHVWEEGLAAAVAAQAADCEHALAVLQVTASELWRLRERETPMIPRAALAEVCCDGSAVEQGIERLMESLVLDDALWHGLAVAPEARRAELDGVVRGLFLRLVDVEDQVARPLEASELWQPFAPGTMQRVLAERVVPRLVNGGLLACRRPVEGAVEHMAPSDTVSLVHDALVAISPRLRGWLAEEQPRRRLLAEVHAGAMQWEAAGRARAALWSGRALRRMRARLVRHRVLLRATEAAFWQACEDRARRGHALIAGTAGLLVLAALAALLVLV